ncbi:MAG: hypothetical protein LBI03_04100, partial [Clostridiales bacterium]|nr:hypothetical protein [Clostridiales bacterium]
PAERIRLVFADSLTKTQRVHLQEMVTSEGHVIFSALPLSGEKSATKEMISGMMAFSVILVISLISTVNVLFYWIKKELPRFRVYMICGAKNSKILFLIAAHTGFIVTLSYLCTLLLALIFRVFNILPEEFLAQMPWYAYGLIFAGGLIFSLLWTVLRAIPLVVRQKMIGR